MSAADRAIRVSTAVAVLGVAGIAAYVSYWHAYEVVRAHGESGMTARLEPATIDEFVYSSSMVVLYAARHRAPAPLLARWLLALGIMATLAAHVTHDWPRGPIGAVAAAWPAVSLVGSYELLLWLIRTAATSAVARKPAVDQAAAPLTGPAAALRLVSTPARDVSEYRGSTDSDAMVAEADESCAGLAPAANRTGGPGWPDMSQADWRGWAEPLNIFHPIR